MNAAVEMEIERRNAAIAATAAAASLGAGSGSGDMLDHHSHNNLNRSHNHNLYDHRDSLKGASLDDRETSLIGKGHSRIIEYSCLMYLSLIS
jgi:hypothetical protein